MMLHGVSSLQDEEEVPKTKEELLQKLDVVDSEIAKMESRLKALH